MLLMSYMMSSSFGNHFEFIFSQLGHSRYMGICSCNMGIMSFNQHILGATFLEGSGRKNITKKLKVQLFC